MSEKFDNLNEVIARMSTALDEVMASSNQPAGEPDDVTIARIATAAASHAIESTRAITALAAMMAVVAMKLDMGWMVDGPGIDIEGITNP